MRKASFFLAVLIATSARAGTLTFTDGSFNPADWSVTVRGSGTTTASQIPTGGNPDAFRQITNNVTSMMWGYHMNNGAVYNPSAQGAITSIDYAEDAIVIAGSGNLGSGPAVMQGGKLFIKPDSFGQTTWTHKTLTGLHGDSFFDPEGGPGPFQPNFSATGGPITFGFWRGNADGPYSMTTGIDNWSMTLNTVPEPAAIGLVLFPVVALISRRR